MGARVVLGGGNRDLHGGGGSAGSKGQGESPAWRPLESFPAVTLGGEKDDCNFDHSYLIIHLCL